MSDKMPVTWHKDNLENMRGHYARLAEQIKRLQGEYAIGLEKINEYDAQILRAELKGIKEFDRERFNKTRDSAAQGGKDK